MTRITCTTCDGEGSVDREIGGDGYGDRCCATADVPSTCDDCDGSGFEYGPSHDPDEPSEEALWIASGWTSMEEMD